MNTATELLTRAYEALDRFAIYDDLRDEIEVFLAAEPEAEPLVWFDGEPPKFYGNEWFIAETTYGDRVVLKALPDDYSYDYKTADETYIKADKIKRWMQFPDSNYCPPRPEPEAEPVADDLLVKMFKALEAGVSISPNSVFHDLIKKHLSAPKINPIGWVNKERNLLSWDKLYEDMEPIYTRPEPAIRKPMTGDEIVIAFNDWAQTYCFTKVKAFEIGVRFAEKHHFGMGVNPSDPDSIDLQSRCRGDKL